MLSDYCRYIITRGRLSNHKLKIETLRYEKYSKIQGHLRCCELCHVLEDGSHVIFHCIKFRAICLNHLELIRRNHSICLFLNPDIEDVIETASFLQEIEKLIN